MGKPKVWWCQRLRLLVWRDILLKENWWRYRLVVFSLESWSGFHGSTDLRGIGFYLRLLQWHRFWTSRAPTCMQGWKQSSRSIVWGIVGGKVPATRVICSWLEFLCSGTTPRVQSQIRRDLPEQNSKRISYIMFRKILISYVRNKSNKRGTSVTQLTRLSIQAIATVFILSRFSCRWIQRSLFGTFVVLKTHLRPESSDQDIKSKGITKKERTCQTSTRASLKHHKEKHPTTLFKSENPQETGWVK